jgi:hypothetical protein
MMLTLEAIEEAKKRAAVKSDGTTHTLLLYIEALERDLANAEGALKHVSRFYANHMEHLHRPVKAESETE